MRTRKGIIVILICLAYGVVITFGMLNACDLRFLTRSEITQMLSVR